MSLVGIPGQIGLGYVSDRIGREWVWTIGSLGFAICYAALLLLQQPPTPALLYVMVVSQGLLGYGLTAVVGAIPAEIFEGPHYGSIFGTLMLASIAGGARAPGSLAFCTASPAATQWDSPRPSSAAPCRRWRSGSPRRERSAQSPAASPGPHPPAHSLPEHRAARNPAGMRRSGDSGARR